MVTQAVLKTVPLGPTPGDCSIQLFSSRFGELAELVEGTFLLRKQVIKNRFVGSNPTLAAKF